MEPTVEIFGGRATLSHEVCRSWRETQEFMHKVVQSVDEDIRPFVLVSVTPMRYVTRLFPDGQFHIVYWKLH